MYKTDDKLLRIKISKSCHKELQIMALREDVDVHDFVTELLEKHAEKKKEKVASN